MTGVARSVIAWKDNTSSRWIAAGTHLRLYAMTEAGSLVDITPLRRNLTLGGNPIATTNGSAAITVTDTGHGAAVGEVVTLSGAAATGGLAVGQLNAQLTIASTPSANTWTAVVSGTGATSTVSAGGGGAVVAKYKIPPGRVDATANTGYGAGAYGVGDFGTARADTGARLQPTVWTLDTWGQDLVACSDSDGAIYQWTRDTAAVAGAVPNAPSGNASIVVTPERILMALKGRTVAWSDQENNTQWTATATNQAGDLDLQTVGTLVCGRPMKGQTLLLTTVDAWSATYVGAPYVYSFQRVGQGCGAISRQALVVTDTRAIWMGTSDFFAYDGSVIPLTCEVRDAVFGDLNTVQAGKVAAVYLSDTGEVMWFYPSGASAENDRYVKYNYRLNCWDVGALVRTCGVAKGAFDTPLMADAAGIIYEHEIGFAYGGAAPFAETGPFKLGNGERLMEAQGLIPDERNAGEVSVSFVARMWPNGAATSYGPYVLTSPTDFLWQADQVTLRYTGAAPADWRVGQFFLDVREGDPLR